MKQIKQISALLLALVALVGLLPVTASAAYEKADLEPDTYVLHASFVDNAAQIYENPDQGLWPCDIGLSNDETFVAFGGAWDRDYLYLAYENLEGNPEPSIILNNVFLTDISYKNTQTHTLVKVALSSASVYMRDFGYFCELELDAGDFSWAGSVLFDGSVPVEFQYIRTEILNKANSKATKVGNDFHFWANAGATDDPYYILRDVEALDSVDVPLVFEFDFTPSDLPETENLKTSSWKICNGLVIGLLDQTANNTQEKRQGLMFGICNVDGELVIASDADDPVFFETGMDASLNAPVHIRVEYENINAYCNSFEDMSQANVRYFINGLYVGEDTDAKAIKRTPTLVGNSLCIYAILVDGQPIEFTVSNLRFSHLNALKAVPGNLDDLDIASCLGSNLSLDNLNTDLELQKYVSNGMFNGDVILWSSSNSSVISSTGKVTVQSEPTPVTLTAKIAGTDISKSFDVTVSGKQLTVPHSKMGVVVDGELNDRGWEFTDVLSDGVDDLPFGMYWNGGYLYIASRKLDTADLSLIVNGQKVENLVSASTEDYTEIQIALSDCGIEAAAGAVCPISIAVGEQIWVGQVTLGDEDTGMHIQEIFLIALIAVAVIFAALLLIAIIKRSLFRKVWYIIILVVVLLGAVFCYLGMNYEKPFDDSVQTACFTTDVDILNF